MPKRLGARGARTDVVRDKAGATRDGATQVSAPIVVPAARGDERVARGVIAQIADGARVHGVPSSVVESTAEEIRALSQNALLIFAYTVGELVIERFYGGDLDEWRSRGRKATSIRALARRLEALRAMSASTLYRCLAGYELLSRLGGVSTLKHATASHVWAVLPVADAERQAELLRRADSDRWSVRELQQRVKRERGPTAARRRRRESVSGVAERVERDAQDLLELLRRSGSGRRPERQRLFTTIMRAREALDAAQSLTSPKRHG